jgi:putrescine transport system permease protein
MFEWSANGAATLAMRSRVRLGVTPDVNALATIIIAIVTLCVVLAGVIMYRGDQRRERDIQAAVAENR